MFFISTVKSSFSEVKYACSDSELPASHSPTPGLTTGINNYDPGQQRIGQSPDPPLLIESQRNMQTAMALSGKLSSLLHMHLLDILRER